MPTIPPTLPARNRGEQLTHFIRKRCQFAQLTALAAGLKIGRLPARAFIAQISLHTEIAFNSATSDSLQLGTTAAGVDILAATTIHATGFNNIAAAAGLGLALTQAATVNAELDVFVKYTQVGAAATVGDVTIMIEFLPDIDS